MTSDNKNNILYCNPWLISELSNRHKLVQSIIDSDKEFAGFSEDEKRIFMKIYNSGFFAGIDVIVNKLNINNINGSNH